MTRKSLWPLLALSLLFVPSVLQASTMEASKDTEVTFNAKITGSSFKAECETVIGTATLDETMTKLTAVEFSLKVEDIKTGMSQRDGHMCKKYLESKKFPTVVFKAAEIGLPAVGTSGGFNGTFAIHGKEKEVPIRITLKEKSADKVVFTATWTLNIGDYDIKQPKFMVVKMEKELKLEANIVLVRK